ncbi:class I SAM-dependent methyltransferase [Prochlorococcus sp. MIT 0601]|uniref:class I SAM-dependent methyltransferase n=1 Tax=Prochlorococcus sp. MIT 0601 TaxID=1499498 RepID=UPI0005337117|nr:class I SAM-dependent methyltransferase [Prochlorococcus sp. MIT 0601]KGG12079.1 Methyltransferase type 11 [Prochlorococcus sp. MIT 0601]
MELNEYKVMARVEAKHWWFIHRLKLIRALIGKEFKKKERKLSLFDAGCGTGGMLVKLKGTGLISTACGCEPEEWAYNYCKEQGLNINNCAIEELNIQDKSFDIVLSMDVLYHRNVDPKLAIKIISNLLKLDGILILNVAAIPSLRRAHDERDWGARRFVKSDLEKLLLETDLEIVSINYWNTLLSPVIWLQSRWYEVSKKFKKKIIVNKSSLEMPSKLINKLMIKILEIENLLSRFIPFLIGSSILLVARKTRVRSQR